MGGRIDINQFYQGLDEMFQRKNTAETMEYLESWLRKAERAEDTSGIVAISNEMGGFCRVSGDTARAKELYKRVLSLLEEMGLTRTEHYATALINYGDVFVNSREPDQALSLFLQAKALLMECGLAGDYRMAALSNNISMVYREIGRLDEAEQALDVAFHIIKGLPQCRSELATTHINLGELQTRQGKLEMAKESFGEACRMFEEDGGRDIHYSSACAGLGQVYYLKGQRAEAVKWYRKALELMERDFGKTDSYAAIAAILEKVKGY